MEGAAEDRAELVHVRRRGHVRSASPYIGVRLDVCRSESGSKLEAIDNAGGAESSFGGEGGSGTYASVENRPTLNLSTLKARSE